MAVYKRSREVDCQSVKMVIENKLFLVLLFVVNFNAYQSDIVEAKCNYYHNAEPISKMKVIL